MSAEVIAFGTSFAEGLELIESQPFTMLEGVELHLRLFDDQQLSGRVLRAYVSSVLIEIDSKRWWLDKHPTGQVGRWVVRAGQGAGDHRPDPPGSTPFSSS